MMETLHGGYRVEGGTGDAGTAATGAIAHQSERASPRVAVLMDGTLHGHQAQATKHQWFIKALQEAVDVCGVGDMTLHGASRLVSMAAAWRPNGYEWRAHYRVNPLTFWLRTRQSRDWLARQRRRPDVILQVGAVSRPAPQSPAIPYVLYLDFTCALTSREWPARVPMLRSERRLWYRLETFTYQDAAAIFTRSHYAARSLHDDYGIPRDKVVVVGAGVNVALPDLALLAQRPTNNVLFVGSDFRRKGGDVLLEAWPHVRSRVPDARLLIVGTPPGRLPDGVEVHHATWDRAALIRALKQASVFVMPSRCETWGDVFLEAMAYGLPCIGTMADAMPEIIEDGGTGFLIPPGDPIALTERIVTLLIDAAQARRMGAAGWQRVEKHFLWEQVTERMRPVLARIVQ